MIVFPDGKTNIPTPKPSPPSNQSGLETIVDLAVDKFDITNGLLQFRQQATALNARGENLRAQLLYDTRNPSYQGSLSLDPLLVKSGESPRFAHSRERAGDDRERRSAHREREADYCSIQYHPQRRSAEYEGAHHQRQPKRVGIVARSQPNLGRRPEHARQGNATRPNAQCEPPSGSTAYGTAHRQSDAGTDHVSGIGYAARCLQCKDCCAF